ncbi:hypothetical protein ABZ470_39900 [Streptosporangium sp. NPDC020072]|uniref:hypothetical protein n=1 Tax=Streptosporangium sp. NPDC020072 TaxID=3154788 RepID=UPI003425E86F
MFRPLKAVRRFGLINTALTVLLFWQLIAITDHVITGESIFWLVINTLITVFVLGLLVLAQYDARTDAEKERQ